MQLSFAPSSPVPREAKEAARKKWFLLPLVTCKHRRAWLCEFTSVRPSSITYANLTHHTLQASTNVSVSQTQTCQVSVDNLDPTQQYILWAINGESSATGVAQDAYIRYTAVGTGSCDSLQFPDPANSTYLGSATNVVFATNVPGAPTPPSGSPSTPGVTNTTSTAGSGGSGGPGGKSLLRGQ